MNTINGKEISVANLNNLTLQEIFEVVAKHLLPQNRQAEGSRGNGPICVYRNPAGEKCAAGCLISDNEYCSKLEGNSLISRKVVDYATIYSKLPICQLFAHVTDDRYKLVRKLQSIHDDPCVAVWRNLLDKVPRENPEMELDSGFVLDYNKSN